VQRSKPLPWPLPELFVGAHRAQLELRRPSGEDPRPARGGEQTCNSFGVKLLGGFLYHLPPNQRYPRLSDPSFCIRLPHCAFAQVASAVQRTPIEQPDEISPRLTTETTMNLFIHEDQREQEDCQNFVNYRDRGEQGQTSIFR
jgi:hypothetical protein